MLKQVMRACLSTKDQHHSMCATSIDRMRVSRYLEKWTGAPLRCSLLMQLWIKHAFLRWFMWLIRHCLCPLSLPLLIQTFCSVCSNQNWHVLKWVDLFHFKDENWQKAALEITDTIAWKRRIWHSQSESLFLEGRGLEREKSASKALLYNIKILSNRTVFNINKKYFNSAY